MSSASTFLSSSQVCSSSTAMSKLVHTCCLGVDGIINFSVSSFSTRPNFVDSSVHQNIPSKLTMLPVVTVDETMYATVHVASMQLSARDLTKITEYVKPHSHKWKEIGQGLGFTADELSNIEARPTLFTTAPYSYLSAMLSDWWQWAPGDDRESTNYATLDSLKTALDKARLGRGAQELCL